ncbi:MAG: DUF6049 family protein [Actinomycetota bacterium]|nr:DUF6049 family protein [Actinomycetota bacterium]
MRALRVTSLALLALLLLGLVPGALVRDDAAAAVAAERPAEVLLESVTPAVGVPDGEVRVVGRIVNRGPTPLVDVQVQLRYSRQPLISRGELARVGEGDETVRTGFALEASRVDVSPELQPGEAAPFELRAPLEQLRLEAFGVYVIGAEALAAGLPVESPAGVARTFLPWVPAGPRPKPLQLSWLWPLVDVPHPGAARTARERLVALVRPGGRLDRLAAAGAARETGLAWMVDPLLLEELEALAAGGGEGAREAQAWLERVRRAASQTELQGLPYADPDVVALVRNGQADAVREAVAEGRRVTERVLGRRALPGEEGQLSWPPLGALDAPTAGVLRAAGVEAFVLPDSALPVSVPLSYTPTGRGRLAVGDPTGGLAEALLYDEALSTLVGVPTPTPHAQVLAARRFVAETAMIAAERPCCTRRVLVVPPRRWDPAPEVVDALLSATTELPWLQPAPVRELRATPPPDPPRGPLRYPAEAAAAELPAPYLHTVARVRREAAVLPDVMNDPAARARTQQALTRDLRQLHSSAYRDEPGARRRAVAALQADLERQRRGVRVIGGSLTFGAREGPIPVTVANDLDTPVTVRLALTPRLPRLLVKEQPPPVTVQPRRRAQVLVPAEAVVNGPVFLDAQVLTPAGERYGPTTELQVNVQQVGGLGLYVTLGAAGLLFVAAGLRLTGRLRGRSAVRPREPAASDDSHRMRQ